MTVHVQIAVDHTILLNKKKTPAMTLRHHSHNIHSANLSTMAIGWEGAVGQFWAQIN